jgi:hypothetical protein
MLMRDKRRRARRVPDTGLRVALSRSSALIEFNFIRHNKAPVNRAGA